MNEPKLPAAPMPSDRMLATSPPTDVTASAVLAPASSTRSIALSAGVLNCSRATDV